MSVNSPAWADILAGIGIRVFVNADLLCAHASPTAAAIIEQAQTLRIRCFMQFLPGRSHSPSLAYGSVLRTQLLRKIVRCEAAARKCRLQTTLALKHPPLRHLSS